MMIMSDSYDFITFSIVDQCNLKCPSCPSEHVSVTGKLRYTPLELCGKVFEKIARDYGTPRISLYSLSEPLLHPDLPAVLDLAADYGLGLEISTNLNTQRDLSPIIEHSALKRFDISLSGFTQEVYQRGHERGRIDIVKRNMKNVARMCHSGKVFVKYLKYKDNIDEEAMMRDFSERLGFTFCSIPATYFPYGDILASVAVNKGFVPPSGAQGLLDRLLVRDLWKVVPSPALAHCPCYNQERILFLNYHAEIFTCNFATYHDFGRIGDFLQLEAEEIRRRKDIFPFCARCRELGIQAQNAIKSTLESEAELQAFFDFLKISDLGGTATTPVYIYGAGLLGRQICSLLLSKGLSVRGFIDDDSGKWTTLACGLPVFSLRQIIPDELGKAVILSGMYLSATTIAKIDAAIHAYCQNSVLGLGAYLLALIASYRTAAGDGEK